MADKVFNTIHIFGFGLAQAIGKDKNVQTARENVTTQLDPVMTEIWSKRPADYTGTTEYHAVNIFNDLFVDFQAKSRDEKGFRVKYSDLDATKLDALATAIFAFAPQTQTAAPATQTSTPAPDTTAPAATTPEQPAQTTPTEQPAQTP